MSRRSRELLELPLVLERLAGQAGFAGGRRLALTLEPADDPAEVALRRAETEEAFLLEETTVSSPGGAHEVRDHVTLAVRGGRLGVDDLEAVLATIGVALEVRAGVVGRADIAPRLAERMDVGVVQAPLRGLQVALERALDGRGGLLDGASSELAGLRRGLAAARREAGDTLRRLAGRLGSHLQERFTTERSGRPVLAVKASSRSAVPGIVHDSSASGQTIFVEPFELVDANNRFRELEAREAAEVERILMELSGRVAEVAGAVTAMSEALAHHDMVLARARLSRAWRGCVVVEGDEVELLGARHPLLDPAAVVPIDLPMQGVRALVVSGPNTGGKTVALKTLGLFALLAQCGLRVPARQARLPVFRNVLTDIGDDQSIAMSLSTFSAHVRRLVGILEVAGAGALVLLDEVAGGTDPEEGGPLAQSILQRLLDVGAVVLATTHLGALKQWAASTPGARNAAVDIDPDTMRPTYRLVMGEPGSSHALEISRELGLDAEVVEGARRAMAPQHRLADELVRAAQRARSAAEGELGAALAARAAAEAAARDAEDRLRELERDLARRRAAAERERVLARERAEQALADASRELTELRAQISAARRAEASRADASPGGEAERDRLLGEASRAQRRAQAALAPPAPEGAGHAVVGDAVLDPVMGFRGTVVDIQGDTAEVQGERMRMRLPVARLVVDTRPSRPAVAVARPAEVRPEVRAAPSEVDVRGQRAEAARAQVREAVDSAAMTGRARLRIIHGHGTGALRTAVRDELARHPLVDRAEPAPPNEGGDGATYAVLESGAAARGDG